METDYVFRLCVGENGPYAPFGMDEMQAMREALNDVVLSTDAEDGVLWHAVEKLNVLMVRVEFAGGEGEGAITIWRLSSHKRR